MPDATSLVRVLNDILTRDRRYHPDAYAFVLATLQDTVRRLDRPRHVTGQELLDGLRRYALDQFGPMTRTVLNAWGLYTTDDVGEIVFALIDAKILGKTSTDSKDDFKARYTFDEAFDRAIRYTLHEE